VRKVSSIADLGGKDNMSTLRSDGFFFCTQGTRALVNRSSKTSGVKPGAQRQGSTRKEQQADLPFPGKDPDLYGREGRGVMRT
jgi:hypothetical protein